MRATRSPATRFWRTAWRTFLTVCISAPRHEAHLPQFPLSKHRRKFGWIKQECRHHDDREADVHPGECLMRKIYEQQVVEQPAHKCPRACTLSGQRAKIGFQCGQRADHADAFFEGDKGDGRKMRHPEPEVPRPLPTQPPAQPYRRLAEYHVTDISTVNNDEQI